MKHVRGQSRHQATLFPEALDDLVPADHPVRVIDAFVESLDLGALGFDKVQPAEMGRPPYHPGDLLKLYIYGYLNQVRSSRRLEKECRRNIDLLWLLNRLCPVFKTIADFRRQNRQALVGVFRAFTQFCREQALFGAELVAIDGSKFRAVASRKAVKTPAGLERELEKLNARIEAYLTEMDAVDAEEPQVAEAAPGQTAAALAALQQRRVAVQALAEQMRVEGARQHVATEPEARLMRQPGGGHAVSYNVQTAVDEKHKLIVTFDVTNEGNDQRQLYPMAKAAKAALEAEALTVVADVGYQNGEQGAQCEADGITAVVPSQRPVNPSGGGFDRSRFVYEPEEDQYRCPAGAVLRRYKTDMRKKVHYYSTPACEGCALHDQCTRSRRRTIARHFQAGQVESMNRRAVEHPEFMRQRRCIVEHPFGSMKRMMENGRFLMRGLVNVNAEMALTALSYNLRRVINILGAQTLCARLAV